MDRFTDQFLQELRDRLPVSQVVGRRIQLKKEGREFKGLSPWNKEKTPSFTVNDDKQIWKDFSSGKPASDIFRFEMEMTGCTFVEAVKTMADLAGIPVPGQGSNRGHKPQQESTADPRPEPDDHPNAPQASGASTRREITKTYDYLNGDSVLIYQVCRLEWVDAGKRKKTFLQRRPHPDYPNEWVWGLDADTYVKGKTDWYRLTDDRESWRGPRSKLEEVPHGLYRFPELRDELGQQPDEQRIVFSPEGEKDCDTLADWGLVATDSSGGSKKWTTLHADYLQGADIVILADNDKSGREYAHRKAASLRGIARRIRVLDVREQWPNCPDGADITDWRDIANGTRDKFFQMVDRLQDWTPVPPESTFNAVRFIDLDKPARELEWLIKKILTRGEVSIWFGPPGCGKSFLVTDAAMAVARGVSWMGLRARQGLVVYQAGEGGLGLKKRLRAYRRHHGLKHGDNVPFVLLPSRIDLFSQDDHTQKLILEIKAWAAFYDAPLELVVIDTFSAASPGANENASEDVSKVLQRCHRIAVETGAHVALVHHTPKLGGSPRGHSSLLGNVENAVEVIRTEQVDAEAGENGRIMRDIREMVVRKQKDGEDGLTRRFVLKQVQMGLDADQEPDTSCIVSELSANASQASTASGRVVPHGYMEMKPNNQLIMRALVNALKRNGVPAPDNIPAVAPGQTVCTVKDWIDALYEIRFSADVDDPDGRRLRNTCKRAVERTYGDYDWAGAKNLIGKDREYVWRTHRRVQGIDPPPIGGGVRAPAPNEPAGLTAPGEEQGDLIDGLDVR